MAKPKAQIPVADELVLYGEIGWDVRARDVLDTLKTLTGATLNVRINSPGGDVFEGVAIYNALKAHPGRVVVHVDALAGSIASVIALAGAEVRMASNAFLMIHNAIGLTYGNADDHREMADLLDKVTDASIAQVYRAKTAASAEQVKTWMDEETWFTAEEAEQAGFVDAVDDIQPSAAATALLARFDLKPYRHVPAQLAALARPIAARTPTPPAALPPIPATQATVSKETRMTDTERAEAEKVKADAETARKELEALKATAARNEQILNLCVAADHPHLAPEYQAGTKTIPEIRDELKGKKKASTPIVTGLKNRADGDVARGFRSPRDFLMAALKASSFRGVKAEIPDERLRPVAVADDQEGGGFAFIVPKSYTPKRLLATVGSDEQGAYADPYGGYMLQPTVLPDLLSVGFEGDPTSGRTQPVPMSTPSVKINARTDKDHTSTISGGFTVSRRAEATAPNASRMTIEQINLQASMLYGSAFETRELITDSPATFTALIETGFRDQFGAAILNEKIRGKGGDQFLGVLTAGCTVSVTKETNQVAATIVHANLVKMRARAWRYGNAIWLANHDTYPQLATLAVGIGASGALVYQNSIVEDRPDMLLGRPIFYTEFCATLGTVGDIILGNWGEYLEGTYSPLQSEESLHARFSNHEMAFKFWLRNAGQPWWRTALTPANSTATLSPFITLATRA